MAGSSPAPTEVRGFPLRPLAEAALLLVTVTAVLGMRRVLVGDWLQPLLLHAVAAHGTAVALRRRAVATAPAVGLAGLAAVVVLCWVHVGHLTTYGIPTPSTIEGLLAEVGDAFGQFADLQAPAPALTGFLVAVGAGTWLTAVLGDWAAFRAGGIVEAVLPSASLFGVAAVLGTDVDRTLVTALWIGSVLAFVVLRRAERIGERSTWVGDRAGRGPRALALVGLALLVASTLVAAVVGPRLPGAEAEAVVDLTDLGGDDPGTRVTVSPLVDIRSRLVQQADVEVFQVRSDVRSYWRLTSLDRFDGRIWSSNGSYGKSSGELDRGVPVASEQIVATQEFRISALAQIWLPAAYEPRSVTVEQPVRYDEVSGTLIVDTEVPTSDGQVYGVTSALPQHRAEALGSASNLIPGEIADRYLELPSDFSPRVADLARSLTAGSASAYEASLRLQDFFRDPATFTYDLEVGAGHGSDVIESFVFDVRRGYCEQFAGSFAAMARAVGIPARVAVGFTPGVADPGDPTLYRVRGEHAHAWPEVFLGEYGWVAFEPTPGRGAPFAEQYTGVPEQQTASGGGGSSATTTPVPPSTEVPLPDEPAVDPNAGTFPPTSDELGVGVGEEEAGPPSPWPGRLLAAVAAVLVLGAGYLALVAGVVAWRRHRRRTEADTPTAQVALAWAEALDAIGRTGVRIRAAETQSQAADRIGHRLPAVDAPLRRLAAVVSSAAYAPEPPAEDDARTALELADEIGERAAATRTAVERLRADFHPRRLRG